MYINIIVDLPRPRKRLMQLMFDASRKTNSRGEKSFDILFLRTPISILGADRIEGIQLAINRLEGENCVNNNCYKMFNDCVNTFTAATDP